MRLISRLYQEGDFENFIQKTVKENMKEFFLKNFGGWNDEVSKRQFFEYFEKGFVYVFELNSIPVGYVTFVKEDETFYVNDFQVRKEFQQKGFGSEIMEFLEDFAKKNKGKEIKLLVFKDNPALKFYLKHGFREINFIPHNNTCEMIKML
ncbi:GNAT family N-acetyltransferase [Candidatus Woesearchaeota archaeon]|nr:GNAT family N-acetyltransferase [Candidatus Woesearchaeota archaeon]